MNFIRQHNAKEYVLITGATGLVGQYLLRELLSANQNLAVVVRPNKRLSAVERIEGIMQRLEQESGKTLPRPVVFSGDICEQSLGLDQQALDWVAANVRKIIHSAAVLTFHGASREHDPWKTNLGGTINVLDICQRCQISELHYVSTSYVCGKRTERVLETDLDCGQEFRNDYERCKFEAEQLVNEAEDIESRTIYRPAVIVGDSGTGYTASYHGLFLYLRLIATLIPLQQRNEHGVIETPVRMPINGDEPRNLVPVDWVAEVIAHLFLNPESHGQTYHLTPDDCPTARQLTQYCCDYYNTQGVEFVGPNAGREPNSQFSERYFENATMYEEYETNDPEFDKTNLIRHAGHLPCPEVSREMVYRFIEFGKKDRWGKRRQPIPTVDCWVAENASKIAASAANVLFDNDDSESSMSFDLHGPGGGQWHLRRDTSGSVSLKPGLGTQPGPVFIGKLNELPTIDGEHDWESMFRSFEIDSTPSLAKT